MQKKIETVYFNDGCVKYADFVLIAAKLHSLDPDTYDFSRMFVYRYGEWGYTDLQWDVRSVCYRPEPECLCALSAQGDIHFGTPAGFHQEKIPDAGSYAGLGAVKQIRSIAGVLYVVGDQGQVYRRTESGWEHFDDGILDREISARALDLNDIDGTGEDDLWVVGFNGRILHRDASGWSDLDSPTNRHLERVLCVGPDEVYVCGNDGTFLRGDLNGFQDLSVEGLDRHFWGLAKFEDLIYLATIEGLFVFDGKTVEPLQTGLDPEIDGYRLDARDGRLWSFGVNQIAFFDGKAWQRVQHPDNPAP